jgi:hypothetical protein
MAQLLRTLSFATMTLRPLPFLGGFIAGLAFLSLLGASIDVVRFKERFARFHFYISAESGYFPTVRQIKSLIDAPEGRGRIHVIIGGSSVLHGVEQHHSAIWSDILQRELGERFRVLNLAMRAGSPNHFANIGAEILIRSNRPVIYVADGNPVRFGVPIEETFYQQVTVGAWLRGKLLPWRPRDEAMSAGILSGRLTGAALGAAFDAVFNFNDLWNRISYRFVNPVWNMHLWRQPFERRANFSDPEFPPEIVEQRRYTNDHDFEMRAVRAQIPPVAPSRDDMTQTTAAMMPPTLRAVTIGIITPNSPHYVDRLSPQEQAALRDQAQRHAEALRAIGLRRVIVPTGYTARDYADRVHLAIPGGAKLAADLAPVIAATANELGYR